jgi:hypothetical protein
MEDVAVSAFKNHDVSYVPDFQTKPADSQAIRARICKSLWSPGVDSEESISPAHVAWRASTTN